MDDGKYNKGFDSRSLISGFTLIEIIIVLAIIFVLSVVAMPKWSVGGLNLGGQVDQLMSDLRFTQSLAMTKGVRYYWIKTSSNTYQIRDSSGNPIRLAFGNTTATLSSGITFGTLSNLPNSLINFDGRGVPYTDLNSPGTALSSTANIPLSVNSTTLTVSVKPTTGALSYS